MEDVLDVYHRPYDTNFPVVGMDELNKQLIKEMRAPLPAEPGKPQRIDYQYSRNGTANIFILFEPLAGRRYLEVTERRTKIDWAHLMRELVDVRYPDAEMVVLVCDKLNTHSKASLYEAFNPEEAKRIADKLDIHYTPKHGSWLNVAECELSHLSRQCLDRRIPDMDTLKKEIKAWNIERNNKAKPVDWQFTVDDARVKLKRLYPTNQS
jgi:hypothetical protein